MNAVSTSFLLPLSQQKSTLSLPPPPPQPHISALRIKEIPKSTTSGSNPTTASKHQLPTKLSLLATIFKGCDNFINNSLDPPLKSCFDPRHVLSGNSAAVGELPPTECEVIYGTLPTSLNGAYVRNGPNPQYYPSGPYHMFDGDGMLHSVRISDGRAIFCSRFVNTYRYTLEKNVGYPVIPNVFSDFNGVAPSILRSSRSALM